MGSSPPEQTPDDLARPDASDQESSGDVTWQRPPAPAMIVLLLLGLAAVVLLVTKMAPRDESATADIAANVPEAELERLEGVPDYMIKGDPNATTYMYEWSDFQCPYCARHADEVSPQIDAAYVDTGQVRVVFRDLALPFHPNAVKAAESARCVGEQGGSDAYWQMYHTLFGRQDEWSSEEDPSATFKTYAASIGVDAGLFATCLDEGQQTEAVKADGAKASEFGLSGTPAFTIQGAVVVGAVPFETFQGYLDLAVAGGTLPTATAEPTEEMVVVDAPDAPIEVGDAPTMGDPDAGVTIIEFSDYQCPYCKMFFDDTWSTLVSDFVETGRVRFAFRDFPWVQQHPAGVDAARAAHCAREQGGDEAYFQMHDALFANQERWSQAVDAGDVMTGTATPSPLSVYGELAAEAGLDGEAVMACLESGQYEDLVIASFEEAFTQYGIGGSPTFIINGQMMPGTMSPDMLAEYVETLERGERLTYELPKSYLDQATEAAVAAATEAAAATATGPETDEETPAP